MPGGGFSFGPFQLDPQSREFRKGGDLVLLPTSHFRLLLALVSRAGEVVSKNDLILAAWQRVAIADSSLTQAVSSLRAVLGPRPPDGHIVTVHGHGYRFAAQVTRTSERADVRPRVDLDALLAPHRAFLEGRAALQTLEVARLAGARAEFERLLTVDPADASVHVGLANACVLQYEATRADPAPDVEALHLAVTHAREACALNPGNAEAWATLGFVLHRSGERENAVAALTRATKSDPRNWLHYLRLGYASWGKDRLAAAERVLVLMPGNPLACVLIATVFIARGAFAEAELALEPGLRAMASESVGPSRFSAVALYFVKGLLCLARGDEDEALVAFGQELALEARGHLYTRECCANTWCAIGAIYLRRGDQAQAREAFEQAIARVAQHPLALAGLALVGKPGDADLQAPGSPPSVPRTTTVSVDVAVARAACLVADGDACGAARLVGSALAAAPPGDAGWRVPIEPLLGVHRTRDAWSAVLEQLRRRAV